MTVFTAGFLFVFGFIGAFINALVGGGGLISLPTLLAVGLPPATAIGTNKLAAAAGNLIAMLTFRQAGKVNLKLLLPVLPWVFVASCAGAVSVQLLSPTLLRPLIIILLIAVFVYSVIKKDMGFVANKLGITKKRFWLASLMLVALAFYDGFFGPGTGSFMIFILLFMGMDFMQAAGSSKLLNLTSNTAALLTFAWFGSVNFSYGAVLAVGMMLGAYAGSRLALTKGTAFIRWVFISVTGVLILKNIYDLLI